MSETKPSIESSIDISLATNGRDIKELLDDLIKVHTNYVHGRDKIIKRIKIDFKFYTQQV